MREARPGDAKTRKTGYLASKFRDQLGTLLGGIRATAVQYVRCVKPNVVKSDREFEMRKVVDQLRSAGVIEAIRIARASYADRLPHAPFARRFGVLVAVVHMAVTL